MVVQLNDMDGRKMNKEVSSKTSATDVNYKDILGRITGFQKHLEELAKTLGGYITKSAEARDKNDELAYCLDKYKRIETFETSSQYAMSIAADIMAKVGDHQTAAIQRIENIVLPNMSTHKTICRCLKRDVRRAMVAEGKMLSRKKLAKTFKDKANVDPQYRNIISDAQKEWENASAESSRLGVLSQEQVVKFEHKRLMDLKDLLESYFKIEITRHAKSIELLTDAYKYIHSIDEEADLEILIKQLKLTAIQGTKSAENLKRDRYTSRKVKGTRSFQYVHRKR